MHGMHDTCLLCDQHVPCKSSLNKRIQRNEIFLTANQEAKHRAFKEHLSKPVLSQSTKMAPFHPHSHDKVMVQVARTVAVEAHILELGRAASDGEW